MLFRKSDVEEICFFLLLCYESFVTCNRLRNLTKPENQKYFRVFTTELHEKARRSTNSFQMLMA